MVYGGGPQTQKEVFMALDYFLIGIPFFGEGFFLVQGLTFLENLGLEISN